MGKRNDERVTDDNDYDVDDYDNDGVGVSGDDSYDGKLMAKKMTILTLCPPKSWCLLLQAAAARTGVVLQPGGAAAG